MYARNCEQWGWTDGSGLNCGKFQMPIKDLGLFDRW